MTDPTIITLVINAIVTPFLVLLTMWAKSNRSSREHAVIREDGFINELNKRVQALEQEIKEVRAELRHRNKEYLELYQEHVTLRAKYEVLEADHVQLKKEYENTVAELSRLGSTCKEEHTKL